MARFKSVLTLWLVIITSWFLLDLMAPYLQPPPRIDSDVVVIYPGGGISEFLGVPVLNGVSVNEFRVLGLASPKVLIFVSHGFTDNSTFGLEVLRNPGFTEVLQHPLLILTYSIVMGRPRVGSGLSLAVTKNILPFTRGFRGKSVIIISCGMVGIDDFAKGLISSGASLVAYYRGYPGRSDVLRILDLILNYAVREGSVNASLLRIYGFTVYTEGS